MNVPLRHLQQIAEYLFSCSRKPWVDTYEVKEKIKTMANQLALVHHKLLEDINGYEFILDHISKMKCNIDLEYTTGTIKNLENGELVNFEYNLFTNGLEFSREYKLDTNDLEDIKKVIVNGRLDAFRYKELYSKYYDSKITFVSVVNGEYIKITLYKDKYWWDE